MADEVIGFTLKVDGVDKATNSVKGLTTAVNDSTKAVDNFNTEAGKTGKGAGASFDNTGVKVKGLKQQLREARDELGLMTTKFGENSTQANAAAQRFAHISDTIGEINDKTKAYNPDTFGRLATIGQGIAGAFATAQGAMAMFGAESKDVQATMVKLQGAIAFSQGIQGIKDFTKSFDLASIATKTATFFQSLYTAAIGASTGAMRLFKTALITSGIGAVVVGLGALVSKLFEAKEKSEDLNKTFEDRLLLQKKYNDITIDFENKIAVLRGEKTEKEAEQEAISIKYFSEQGKRDRDEIDARSKNQNEKFKELKKFDKDLLIETDASRAKRAEIVKFYDDLDKRLYNDSNAIRTAAKKAESEELIYVDEKYRKEAEVKAKEASEKAEVKAKEASEKAKALNDKAREAEKKAIEDQNKWYLDQMSFNQEERKKLEDEEVARRKKELDDIKELQSEVLAAYEKYYDHRTDQSSQYYKVQYQIDKERYETELADVNISEEAKAEIRKKYAAATIKYEKEKREESTKLIIDGINEVELILSTINDIRKQRDSEALTAIDVEYAAKISAAAGNAEAVYQIELEKYNAMEEIKKKGFESNKKMLVALAVMDSAKAIISSLAMSPVAYGPAPNPIGIASLILATTAGIANLAKILSTNYEPGTPPTKGGGGGPSKFAKGGLLDGPSHLQGGIKTAYGEVEGGEFVMNRYSSKSFLPLLEKMNAAGNANMINEVVTNNSTPIFKTYVVASDMTSEQQKEFAIRNIARL